MGEHQQDSFNELLTGVADIQLTSFSVLPNELIHQIFNLAAASSTECCLALSLVCSWARELAVPHLLSVVIITDVQKEELFKNYLLSPHNDFNPGMVVHSLWWPQVLLSTLDALPNIRHLAILEQDFVWLMYALSETNTSSFKIPTRVLAGDQDLHLTVLNLLRFQHLSPFLNNTPPLVLRVWRKITHLFLTAVDSESNVRLDHFPRLTHLAIPFCTNFRHVHTQLATNALSVKSLKVLVLTLCVDHESCFQACAEVWNWVREVRHVDKRLHLAIGYEGRYDGIRKQWEEEVRGQQSLWERAIKYTAQMQVTHKQDVELFV